MAGGHEIQRGSMYKNKVWTLEELLDGRNTAKYRWIFKRKTHDDGEKSPLRKLNLLQICFQKVQRVYYDETFSHVAMLKVCWNYVSSCCIIYEILQIGSKNIVSSTVSLKKGCM